MRRFVLGIGFLILAVTPFIYIQRVSTPGPGGVALGLGHQVAGPSVAPGQPGVPAAPGGPAVPVAAPVVRRLVSFEIRRVSVDAGVEPSPSELLMVDLVNADRLQNGLEPLTFDPALLPVARTRGAAQLSLVSLSHYDATGGLAFVNVLSDFGVPYRLAGENLARLPDSEDVAPRAEDALMRSPTHRRNILEPSFNLVAIGTAVDGNGRLALAQIFRDAR